MPDKAGRMATGSFAQRALNVLSYRLVSNVTPVSLTNPTSATDLMTYTFPPNPMGSGNILNDGGKGFDLFCAGTYNLAASSTVVFTIKLGGVTLATFTTG